jgi:hypothetical protein
MRAAAALPALFSSIKLMVELMKRSVMIPTKSCQSGGFPYTHKKKCLTMSQNKQIREWNCHKNQNILLLTPPFARAIAMIAAASITHDRGFHIKPRNFKNFLS